MPVPEAPFPGRALRVALTARWSQRGGEKRDSGSRVQIFPSSDAKHVVERPNKVFTLPTCPAAAGGALEHSRLDLRYANACRRHTGTIRFRPQGARGSAVVIDIAHASISQLARVT